LYKNIEEETRKTLIAKKITKGNKTFYQFNIYLQGENETVFFDVHN
jgi:protocatechuate 3,4-dioxygenase alpha subunit